MPPCKQRKIKLGRVLQSTGSYNTDFALRLTIKSTIMEQTTPRMNVSYMTATPPAFLKSCYMAYMLPVMSIV